MMPEVTSRPAVYSRRQSGRYPPPPEAIYVGRPTVWGNPFFEGVDGTREEVIQRYRRWLLLNLYLVARAKHELRGKDLVCWCAPLPCHADVLLEVANS